MYHEGNGLSFLLAMVSPVTSIEFGTKWGLNKNFWVNMWKGSKRCAQKRRWCPFRKRFHESKGNGMDHQEGGRWWGYVGAGPLTAPTAPLYQWFSPFSVSLHHTAPFYFFKALIGICNYVVYLMMTCLSPSVSITYISTGIVEIRVATIFPNALNSAWHERVLHKHSLLRVRPVYIWRKWGRSYWGEEIRNVICQQANRFHF